MAEPWVLNDNPTRYGDYNWYSDELPARKFYLFVAEIGRRVRPLMTDPGPVRMLDLCEQCAEGRMTEDELSDASDENRPENVRETYVRGMANHLYWWVADRYKVASRGVEEAEDVFAVMAAVEAGLLSPTAEYEEVRSVREHPIFVSAHERTQLEWGALVRDIYGPDPFRPVIFDPAWRTETAVALARGMYEGHDFGIMPVLADALEDAGCDHPGILAHYRDPQQVHVRGCWVVDLVLGKS